MSVIRNVTLPVGLISEADVTFAVTSKNETLVSVGQPSEITLAQAIQSAKVATLSVITELDSGLLVRPVRSLLAVQVLESEQSLGATYSKLVNIAALQEFDVSLGVTIPGLTIGTSIVFVFSKRDIEFSFSKRDIDIKLLH